ncbi:MAG TPA: arsenite methyltransferase [Chloroflexota bacterium]|nr:arsenite methyltransferase [Chloroflexota bacterium]
MSATEMKPDEIRDVVQERYGEIALEDSGCGCAPDCCGPEEAAGGSDAAAKSRRLGYSDAELADVPEGANLGLGCGNPQAIAALQPGETVLDLGSGAGFDVFLAGGAVGDTGRAIGVDMTASMISRARANAAKAGVTNVEFRLGEIEHLPVADATVDVVMSNCVINLSPEKPQVYREALRVLKPGGRLAVSDVVATAPLPDEIRNDPDHLAGCVSGAALVEDLRAMLLAAGFEDVSIRPKGESREFIQDWSVGRDAVDYIASADIAARRPGT